MASQSIQNNSSLESPIYVFMVAWYPALIRLTALGFFIFFSTLALHSLHLIHFGDQYISFARWGSDSEANELMICTIYIVWSLFLWRFAKAPFKDSTFMDFTIVANIAHFGVMIFQGFLMKGEHHHLLGDVLLAWVGFTPLIIFWFVIRRHLEELK